MDSDMDNAMNSDSSNSDALTTDDIASAERLLGLEFTPAERKQMLAALTEQRKSFESLRALELPNRVPPALRFVPESCCVGRDKPPEADVPTEVEDVDIQRPDDLEALAFCTVSQLGALLRNVGVSSLELTRLYLNRLKRYDGALHCVITLTEELALEQAARADEELARGIDRGPLHGVPYGAKDLLATRGIPTTWGAAPFKEQVFDKDAAVIRRLEQAGAVLVAKLSLGELAMDDVWFGGQTKNPWDISQGSSGSSAGSAAATAAGLVGFSIGSETLGSIVSPCCRCAVSGLRPTFGHVSTAGAMSLSWSMDKLGPICRSAADCELVFRAIADSGEPFGGQLEDLRVGYVKEAFATSETKAHDEAVLESLRSLGVEPVPLELPDYPLEDLTLILFAEAAAAFDALTRSNQDDLLARQGPDHWPNRLRAARFIPAVEYLQANRVRTLLLRDMARLMASFDAYLCPSSFEYNTLLTNLTGQPMVCVPHGFTDSKPLPNIMAFTGKFSGEATILALAQAFQESSGLLGHHPPLEALR